MRLLVDRVTKSVTRKLLCDEDAIMMAKVTPLSRLRRLVFVDADSEHLQKLMKELRDARPTAS